MIAIGTGKKNIQMNTLIGGCLNVNEDRQTSGWFSEVMVEGLLASRMNGNDG